MTEIKSNLNITKEELPAYSRNLRSHRINKHWTQKEAAYYLSQLAAEPIEIKRYQAWEEGRAELPYRILIKVAEMYNDNIDSLLKTA